MSEFNRGWLAAVDALDEMAKAMDEKAESFRSPSPFDPATAEEADAATTGWVLEQAGKLLRERIPETPVRDGSLGNDPRYPSLLADAKARVRNENLDGSPRRHAVAKGKGSI